MKTLVRHKTFIKDMRNYRLTETQATKLFLYVAQHVYLTRLGSHAQLFKTL